jgi:hypothetical protein
MEFPYQPATATSSKNIFELAEFTLLQSEVNKVIQYLEDHHWTITAKAALKLNVISGSLSTTSILLIYGDLRSSFISASMTTSKFDP